TLFPYTTLFRSRFDRQGLVSPIPYCPAKISANSGPTASTKTSAKRLTYTGTGSMMPSTKQIGTKASGSGVEFSATNSPRTWNLRRQRALFKKLEHWHELVAHPMSFWIRAEILSTWFTDSDYPSCHPDSRSGRTNSNPAGGRLDTACSRAGSAQRFMQVGEAQGSRKSPPVKVCFQRNTGCALRSGKPVVLLLESKSTTYTGASRTRTMKQKSQTACAEDSRRQTTETLGGSAFSIGASTWRRLSWFAATIRCSSRKAVRSTSSLAEQRIAVLRRSLAIRSRASRMPDRVPCAQSLRSADFLSKKQLREHIASFIAFWNKDPTPFIWTKPAAAIIRSHRRMLARIS